MNYGGFGEWRFPLVAVVILLLGACGGDDSRLVTVTSDGRILYATKPVTINELMRLARESDRPIKLRAGDNARWMHVQWVLAALHEAGVMSVRNGGALPTQDIRRRYHGEHAPSFSFP